MESYGIILAAGKGNRMRDEAAPAEFPKVLRQANGRPLIGYVIDVLRGSGIRDISIVVGFGADYIRRTLGGGYRYILQTEQLGSGHAVACAREALGGRRGQAIVMCGDSPLLTVQTVSSLEDRQASTGAVVALVSAVLDDPAGYGRIKRAGDGGIMGVIEEACASDDEKAIREINGGAYAFDSAWLWANIGLIEPNRAGELNLTDLVRVAVAQGMRVESVPASPEEVMGVNTPAELARVEETLRRRAASGGRSPAPG